MANSPQQRLTQQKKRYFQKEFTVDKSVNNRPEQTVNNLYLTEDVGPYENIKVFAMFAQPSLLLEERKARKGDVIPFSMVFDGRHLVFNDRMGGKKPQCQRVLCHEVTDEVQGGGGGRSHGVVGGGHNILYFCTKQPQEEFVEGEKMAKIYKKSGAKWSKKLDNLSLVLYQKEAYQILIKCLYYSQFCTYLLKVLRMFKSQLSSGFFYLFTHF